MRLGADVREVTSSARQLVGGAQFAPAVRVEIVDEDGAFFLLRYSEEGFAGDTWHATLDEAKRQALFEFAIRAEDWGERQSS